METHNSHHRHELTGRLLSTICTGLGSEEHVVPLNFQSDVHVILKGVT